MVQGNDVIKNVMLIFDYIFCEFVVFYFGCYELVYVLLEVFSGDKVFVGIMKDKEKFGVVFYGFVCGQMEWFCFVLEGELFGEIIQVVILEFVGFLVVQIIVVVMVFVCGVEVVVVVEVVLVL